MCKGDEVSVNRSFLPFFILLLFKLFVILFFFSLSLSLSLVLLFFHFFGSFLLDRTIWSKLSLFIIDFSVTYDTLLLL